MTTTGLVGIMRKKGAHGGLTHLLPLGADPTRSSPLVRPPQQHVRAAAYEAHGKALGGPFQPFPMLVVHRPPGGYRRRKASRGKVCRDAQPLFYPLPSDARVRNKLRHAPTTPSRTGGYYCARRRRLRRPRRRRHVVIVGGRDSPLTPRHDGRRRPPPSAVILRSRHSSAGTKQSDVGSTLHGNAAQIC